MVSPWVKICGVTNLEDARACIQSGADALGFIFVSTSPRVITRRQVEKILLALPPTVLTVAVVADEDPDFVRGLLRVCPFKAVQFHGREPAEEVLALKGEVKLIKAIRLKSPKDLEAIPRYQGVDLILLDSHHPVKIGGTGARFDWQWAVRAKEFGIPLIVAGGLNPSNVAQVVREVKPYGVDVASGVEASHGKKDADRVREFILQAKSAVV